MIDALEDYHACTSCGTPVHDFGPGADAINIEGHWFHVACYDAADDDGNREPTSAEEDAYSALDISYSNVMDQAQRMK